MVGMWPYTHGILSAALYAADAAAFDGVNDNLTSTSALSTAADGKEGILSFWFRPNSTAGDGVTQRFLDSSGASFFLQKTTANTFYIGWNASTAAAAVYDFTSSTAAVFTSTGGWRHLLYTWSTLNGLDMRIDGSTVGVGVLPAASTRTGDYSLGHWTWASDVSTANRAYADFFDIYLNFSTDGGGAGAILSKFRDGSGKPVDLGTDGATPTGTAPIMFLHLDDGQAVENFANNIGSGSSFSITGALVTSTSSPTD